MAGVKDWCVWQHWAVMTSSHEDLKLTFSPYQRDFNVCCTAAQDERQEQAFTPAPQETGQHH